METLGKADEVNEVNLQNNVSPYFDLTEISTLPRAQIQRTQRGKGGRSMDYISSNTAFLSGLISYIYIRIE